MNLLVNQPAATAVATLVLAHGAGAPMDSDFMNSLVQALVERDFAVVRFEFPYMAQRREDGKKRPPNKASILIETFEQVIADVQTLPDVSKPLLIGGKSMGGRIASMLADNPAVDGVCCFGYPFHPPGKPEKLAERIAHLVAIETPVLIFQGTRDPFGKPEDLAGIRLSSKVKLHWLEDGNHDLSPRVASGLTQYQHIQAVASKIQQQVKRGLN